MFGSEMLDVAIGLAFVYLILSLLAVTLTELIARALALRSHNLFEGIKNLLDDPKGKCFAKEFYANALIMKLARKNRGFSIIREGAGKPSYIPTETFVMALFSQVMKRRLKTDPPNDLTQPSSVADLRGAILKIEYEKVKEQLLMVVDAVSKSDDEAKELAEAKKNVGKWFDNAMERVNGWYRRQTQLITLAIALVVALLFNADSILIYNSLSNDATLREAVVAMAQKTSDEDAGGANDANTALLTRAPELRDELESIQLIGWPATGAENDPRSWPNENKDRGMRFLGWLFTALAVSLGAPFWFDTLNKLVNLRATGKRPEQPEEPEEDKQNVILNIEGKMTPTQ